MKKGDKKMKLEELDQNNGGADFSLVELSDDGDTGKLTPHCKIHRAMNKVSSSGIWRCLQSSCRAGCIEKKKSSQITVNQEKEIEND